MTEEVMTTTVETTKEIPINMVINKATNKIINNKEKAEEAGDSGKFRLRKT